MTKNDLSMILQLRDFIDKEIEDIARADDEYECDSIDYLIDYLQDLDDNEIRTTLYTYLKDRDACFYGMYMRMGDYCNYLISLENCVL